jgi:hypothetical protein
MFKNQTAISDPQLSIRTIYVPDSHADVDPSEEMLAFESLYEPYDTKFPDALPWYASFTPNNLDTRKVKILYSPKSEAALESAYEKFDREWNRTHP